MDTIQDGVEHMNINDLVHKYYLSNDFNVLRDKTKVDYKYFLGVACDKFATVKYKKITTNDTADNLGFSRIIPLTKIKDASA